MANTTRCKVTVDDLRRGRGRSRSNSSDDFRTFKQLLGLFRKRVNESGVLTTYKEKQYYESKGEKRRRKKREMEHNARKERVRSHFG